MATARMYLNGLTTGIAGHNPLPQKRGEIKGWTPGAVRRHTRWLYSVDGEALGAAGEAGYAVTLTLRDLPPSHEDWVRLRNAWLQRMRDRGAVRTHWVVEWQERGVPHLHAAVYFADAAPRPLGPGALREMPRDLDVLLAWTEVAARYRAQLGAQHAAPITGTTGWLKYLSKHASRGVKHYQRTGKPQGWDKTGRLWGHTGSWPTLEPIEASITTAQFHRLRRLVRAWRIADARASGDPRRIAHARRMLACPDRRLSAVRGVSDWVPEFVALRLIDLATTA